MASTCSSAAAAATSFRTPSSTRRPLEAAARTGVTCALNIKAAGYTYVDNTTEFASLGRESLPVLGLFESSHMEWEWDRATDAGGEPSLTAMTVKAIDLLKRGQRRRGRPNRDNGFFLMVESGRIDHAHHDGNALRALHDTQEFDKAIAAALQAVDLRDTLVIVSADHSHVFNVAGYPIRPLSEMPYPVRAVRRVQLWRPGRQRHPRPGLRRGRRQPLCGTEH